jgi:hypothetical protein
MSASEGEDLREEICTRLAIGHENGEGELDTITRLVWVERHKIAELHNTLMTKGSVADAGLRRKRRQKRKLNNVLEWKLTARPA